MRKSYPGEFEQMVLVAILRAGDAAYATRVSDELERRAGRRVSRGQLYSSLDRLEGKGLVEWEVADGTEERGGQPRRRFALTEEGLAAVRAAHEAWMRLTDGLGDVLETG